MLAAGRGEGRLLELVERTLVEKAAGFRESLLAVFLLRALSAFVDSRRLGLVSGSDGMVRLFPDLVRIPGAAFVSWSRLPGGRVPEEPVPLLAPDLVVEVVSAGNTPGEMARKLRECFSAGVRLAWVVDPAARAVAVHHAPADAVLLREGRCSTVGTSSRASSSR